MGTYSTKKSLNSLMINKLRENRVWKLGLIGPPHEFSVPVFPEAEYKTNWQKMRHKM